MSKDLQLKLDQELKAKQNLEDLAQRQEQKANALQTEYEKLERNFEKIERQRKVLEVQVEEFKLQRTDQGSKEALLAQRKKLLHRISELEAELEEALNVPAQDTSAQEILDSKLEALEESRRTLLVSQRVAQQVVDEKQGGFF